MGPIPINDKQIPPQPPHPLKSSQIELAVKKDEQCSETYEKTIFRFFIILRNG